MKQDDHLSNKVSLDARITETSVSAKAKSRAIAAFDRLLGAFFDVPAAKLESIADRIRARGRLETSVIDAISDIQIGEISNHPEAAQLIDQVVAPQMKLLANKAFVVRQAVYHLSLPSPGGESESESSAEEVDPDWIDHFGRHAEMASSEKVRDLWARVLAGEVRHPGSFSLTSLRLLAELDQQMAAWFDEEAKFRIEGKFILRPHNLVDERLEKLVFLEQVGLIHHVVEIGGIARTFKPDSNGFSGVLEGDLCLRMHIDHVVELGIIPFTRVGKEIASILSPVDPLSVLNKLGKSLPSTVKSIDICRVLAKDQNQVKLSAPIQVLRPETASTN